MFNQTTHCFRKCQQLALKRTCSTEAKSILVKDENEVRKVVMNSPKTRNALSLRMMDELLESIKSINNTNLRCLVISSSGPVFSSGHNLKDLANGEEEFYLETFSKCAKLMIAIQEAPVPVLAAVNGIAAAAGCQLVASCDIVIASDKSQFSTPGANFGIFCSTPGIALSRSVSRKAAARMLFTGLPINAREAYDFGLVSKICKENELDEEVEKQVAAIRSKSRSVVELGKKFFYEQLEKDIRSAYSLGARVMTDNLLMADGYEGLKSFVEKRPPTWKNDFTKKEE